MSFVHLNIDKMGKKSKRKCVVLLLSPAAQFIVFHGSWDFNIEVTMIVSCYPGVSRLFYIKESVLSPICVNIRRI